MLRDREYNVLPGIIAGSKQLLALNCEAPDSTTAFVQSSPKDPANFPAMPL